jgi:serine/threonine protein kinase
VPRRQAGKRSKRSLRAPLDELNRPTVTGSPSERSATGAGQDGPQFRLGHYAIERKLGEGGMGVVYAAHDEILHRTVALKTMSSLEEDETARQRFWREARAAASVNHPNICQIYEIGEDHGELFIAMELLEGTPLTARLDAGPMGLSETVSIGCGILAALSALHARGLVHRDLKPSNVFLTPHGVKVLDFGLARPAPRDEAQIVSDLTRPGVVMGTPRYMAPEQALGETVDHRTDLFFTGAILFEMLAGRAAFIGNTTVAILHATVHEQPPALTGSPAVTAVDRVIRRALAKRPGERPASAEAMADELREVHTGQDDKAVLTVALTRLVVLPFRPTSFEWTILMTGDIERLLALAPIPPVPASIPAFASLGWAWPVVWMRRGRRWLRSPNSGASARSSYIRGTSRTGSIVVPRTCWLVSARSRSWGSSTPRSRFSRKAGCSAESASTRVGLFFSNAQ